MELLESERMFDTVTSSVVSFDLSFDKYHALIIICYIEERGELCDGGSKVNVCIRVLPWMDGRGFICWTYMSYARCKQMCVLPNNSVHYRVMSGWKRQMQCTF